MAEPSGSGCALLIAREPDERENGNVKCATLVIGIGVPVWGDARRVILVSIEKVDDAFDLLENWRMMDLEDDDCWDWKALRALAPGLHRVHAHFWFSTTVGVDFIEHDCGVRVAEVGSVG